MTRAVPLGADACRHPRRCGVRRSRAVSRSTPSIQSSRSRSRHRPERPLRRVFRIEQTPSESVHYNQDVRPHLSLPMRPEFRGTDSPSPAHRRLTG
jgi:hypothetical protein